MAARRVVLLSAVLALCVLVAVLVPAAAAAGSGTGCAPACGGGSQLAQRPARSVPDSCVRDPGCGGGVALGLGMIAGIGVLAGAVSIVGPASTRRRRRLGSWQPLGRSHAGGLFRPPRVLLDV